MPRIGKRKVVSHLNPDGRAPHSEFVTDTEEDKRLEENIIPKLYESK